MKLSEADLADIQGLVRSGLRHFPHAAYVLVAFGPERRQNRAWLREVAESGTIETAVTTGRNAAAKCRDVGVNVAFTRRGLEALELDRDAIATFSQPFREGMAARFRRQILGDAEDAAGAPAGWDWGDASVDALILVFADTRARLDQAVTRWIERGTALGAFDPGHVRTLYAEPIRHGEIVKEPFGFADGISDPRLSGMPDKRGVPQHRRDVIADGECLLGYPDGGGIPSPSPSVHVHRDPEQRLDRRTAGGDPARVDLGYNGTYLVFRQMDQEVERFHAETAAKAADLALPAAHLEALLVGRWHDGSPLALHPDASPAQANVTNDFAYRDGDPHGMRCPIGSHVRRANPRDTLGDKAEEGWGITSRHRIFRRGRIYDDRRGLHFICLNADIGRQFEFVLRNWLNEPTFGGVLDEDDPIITARRGRLTLGPQAPDVIWRRAAGLQRYVTVRGGGYFFLPSVGALRYLASDTRIDATVADTPVEEPALEFVRRARYPLLLAASLLALPLLALAPGAASIFRPFFSLQRPRDAAIVITMASLAAAVSMLNYRLVRMYFGERFRLRRRAVADMTWKTLLTWQALTVPIAVSCVVYAFEGEAAGASLVPLGCAAGYLASFLLLAVVDGVRAYGTRSEAAAASLFLPSGAAFGWLHQRPTPLAAAGLGWLYRFVEQRMASWPPGLTAGYVDSRTRRLLPGHAAGLVLMTAFVLAYAAGYVLFSPAGARSTVVPPLAYLLFVLLVVGWVAAAAAFFVDRYRVPVVAIALAWIAAGVTLGWTDHEFPVLDGAMPTPPSPAAVVAQADLVHGPRPIVVVAAGGGGIHQAAWSARTLAALVERWPETFAGSVRFVSAVSAGSVGAMFFADAFDRAGDVPAGNRIFAASIAPASSDAWWGLAYPDLLRGAFPWLPRNLFRQDRNWALQQTWVRELRRNGRTAVPTVGAWIADAAAARRPAIAFNVTGVEAGERLVLGSYAPSPAPRCAPTGGRDVPIVTAAGVSAAFPLVSPFARPAGVPGCAPHLADGGYWDNTAEATALQWIRDLLRDKPEVRPRLAFIRIPPMRDTRPPAPQERSWLWQLVAPVSTYLTVQTDGQRARSDFERALSGEMVTAELPYSPRQAALAWHLSNREIREIDEQWLTPSPALLSELRKLEPLLGPMRP